MNFVVLMLATAVGFFCVGYLWGYRPVLFWKIKWIETEHDLARCQNRKPRDISEIENVKTNGGSAMTDQTMNEAEQHNATTPATISPVQSDPFLAKAHVGIDPCRKRGQVCRGAYITNEDGVMYMDHAGVWTRGISDDANCWWDDERMASDFLHYKRTSDRR